MTLPDIAHRFYDAIQSGDVAAASACFLPDAKIWHNYDNAEQSVEENMALLAIMVEHCAARDYRVHRMEPTSDGYLQRHTLSLTTQSGKAVTTEALALVTVEQGLISYIEEFLDPAPVIEALKA